MIAERNDNLAMSLLVIAERMAVRRRPALPRRLPGHPMDGLSMHRLWWQLWWQFLAHLGPPRHLQTA